MKKTLLAASMAMAAASATAGTVEQPNMDVTVITQSAAGGMEQQWLVPTILVAVLLVVIGGMGSSSFSG